MSTAGVWENFKRPSFSEIIFDMRKTLKRALTMGVAIFAGVWIAVQVIGRDAPTGLGVFDGSLAECPSSPNCVCSYCEGSHQMPPLTFKGDATTAKEALKNALAKEAIAVVEERESYLHAVATTPIMHFRDDLEFLIQPEAKRIQFRSASRLGKSDLGKNRARLNKIIRRLSADQIIPEAEKR